MGAENTGGLGPLFQPFIPNVSDSLSLAIVNSQKRSKLKLLKSSSISNCQRVQRARAPPANGFPVRYGSLTAVAARMSLAHAHSPLT